MAKGDIISRTGARLLLFLAICFAVVAMSVPGQDLGSSNKLFGGAKKTTSSPVKAAKKAPAKTKASAAKSKTTAKKKTPAARTTAVEKPAKLVKVEIAPAQPSGEPVSAAAERLFESLIEDGNTARDARNYSAAEAAYKRAKAIKPRDSRAVYGLGNLYSDQQLWEAAEEAYRAALQIEPTFAITHVALSYVLTQPVAAPNLSERYEEAEKVARRAIQLAPSNALAFDQLGVALELRGLIGAETENAYRRAIQLDPTFAPAYAHLGRLLRRRGLSRESAAAYETAIKMSTDVSTMVLVAEVMQSEQRFAESEQLLRKALESDPRNPAALLLLGRALTTQQKYPDAERVLRTSLSVSPNAFRANSLLGTLYARQGKLELAENALLQALRFVSPLEKRSLSRQFETVADGYMKSGNPRSAERTYRQAVNLDTDNEALASKLAQAQRG